MFLSFKKIGNNFSHPTGQDLHVFVPDDDRFNQSLDKFFEIYSRRTKRSREFWLLDFTGVNKSVKELAETKLTELPNLDLDDDLYLVEWNAPESSLQRFDVPV